MDFVCKKNRPRWFPSFLSPTPSPVLIIPKGNGHNILKGMSLSPSNNKGRGAAAIIFPHTVLLSIHDTYNP